MMSVLHGSRSCSCRQHDEVNGAFIGQTVGLGASGAKVRVHGASSKRPETFVPADVNGVARDRAALMDGVRLC